MKNKLFTACLFFCNFFAGAQLVGQLDNQTWSFALFNQEEEYLDKIHRHAMAGDQVDPFLVPYNPTINATGSGNVRIKLMSTSFKGQTYNSPRVLYAVSYDVASGQYQPVEEFGLTFDGSKEPNIPSNHMAEVFCVPSAPNLTNVESPGRDLSEVPIVETVGDTDEIVSATGATPEGFEDELVDVPLEPDVLMQPIPRYAEDYPFLREQHVSPEGAREVRLPGDVPFDPLEIEQGETTTAIGFGGQLLEVAGAATNSFIRFFGNGNKKKILIIGLLTATGTTISYEITQSVQIDGESGQITTVKDAYPDEVVSVFIEADEGVQVNSIKIPGMNELAELDLISKELAELRKILEDPGSYPNYVMLAAHRGYWMYAPENSLEAFQNGIDIGADMIEGDLKMTADNQIMVAHDFHLGRLTNLPSALQNPAFEQDGYYKFAKMKFCDIRPDLCPGGQGYDADNPNNCNTCTPTEGVNNTEPVQLIRPNGQVAEVVPTLREAFDLLSQHPVLIDLDKIDPGTGLPDDRFPDSPIQVKTYFFDSLYKVAVEKGVLRQIIVKQRIDKFSPSELAASTVVDWSQWYFTPTAFSDANTDNCGGSLQNCLDGYFDHPEINCPGVEYIYLEDDDPVFTSVYNHIRTTKNNRIFQFPSYPENGAGVWNPKPILFSDINPSFDRRNDWNWLLQPERRPDVIISDRFEVLKELLETLEMRQK